MLAPSAIPASVRALIEREVLRVVRSADFQARLRAQHLQPIGSNGAEASAVLKAAAHRWKAAITGIQHPPE